VNETKLRKKGVVAGSGNGGSGSRIYNPNRISYHVIYIYIYTPS
jgi:hypothetical protein